MLFTALRDNFPLFFVRSYPVFAFIVNFLEICNPKLNSQVRIIFKSLFFSFPSSFHSVYGVFLPNYTQKCSVLSVSNIFPMGNPIFNSCSSNFPWKKCFSSSETSIFLGGNVKTLLSLQKLAVECSLPQQKSFATSSLGQT